MSFLGRCFDVMTFRDGDTFLMCMTSWCGSYVPGIASSRSWHSSNLGETYCNSKVVNCSERRTGEKLERSGLRLKTTYQVHRHAHALPTDLRELFRDTSEDMIVELPCLSEVLHIGCCLILATPVVCFGKVTPICLEREREKLLNFVSFHRNMFVGANFVIK